MDVWLFYLYLYTYTFLFLSDVSLLLVWRRLCIQINDEILFQHFKKEEDTDNLFFYVELVEWKGEKKKVEEEDGIVPARL